MKKKKYKSILRELQIELVKLQRHVIASGERLLVLFEGRDAAGKDGTIKRIVEHLSPRETRVVALGKPTERERGEWYFQRYVEHLPTAGELVLLNRSWYNRVGVEKVMGFSSRVEQEKFLETVGAFEDMLVRDGITLMKYYLDISRNEQRDRLRERARSPLTQWKVSPIDAQAQKHWKDYSRARNKMLLRTHTGVAPWHIVRADNKRVARLGVIRDILDRLHYEGKIASLATPSRNIVYPFDEALRRDGGLAK